MAPRTSVACPLVSACLCILLSIFPTPSLIYGLELPGSRSAAHLLMSEIVQKAPGKDVYHSLSSKQKGAWTYGEGRTINETISSISSVPLDILIDVRLVGMQGDGATSLHIATAQLERYLAALHGDMETVALQPELRRLLPLKPVVSFRVSHASDALKEAIHSALERSFMKARSSQDDNIFSPYMMVPYRGVDDLVHADWRHHAESTRRAAPATFTLYVMTPTQFTEHYAYSYDPEKPPRVAGDPSGSHLGMDGSCPGVLWCSNSPYAWVDLSAGPIVYGPGLGHQGQVLGHSLPRPDVFQSIHVANTAILPDLAALVWSACKHLVWPPAQTADLQYHEEVVVQIVHIHDTLLPPGRHVDTRVLVEQLKAAVPEVVEVNEKYISFAECDVCVAAFTSATKLRTSSDMSSQVQAQVRPFIDRLVLHDLMQRFKDRIFGYADVRVDESTDAKHHVLPVFIYDLSQEVVLLLDDEARAAAFPDMVVAVATKAGEPVRTHYSCFYQRVQLDGKDLTREVLGAILQSGWGIAHSASYHSPATGENANYLWSVGNTVFGPFSNLSSLSAPQAMSVHRNHALTLMDDASRRVLAVMEGFAQLCPKGHVECVLDGALKNKLVRRLNMFEFKVSQAARALSTWDARTALAYARSSVHDAAAIELIAVHGSLGRVNVAIKCEGHIETWQFFVYPAFAMLAWLAAVALRLRVSRPKLSKQY